MARLTENIFENEEKIKTQDLITRFAFFFFFKQI